MSEAQIRRRIAEYAQAVSAKDIDGAMSFFAAELVSFDLEPPLRYSGADNKRRRWLEGFAAYDRIDYEVRELQIATHGELAFVHGINHFNGSMSNGRITDTWVRWTACFRNFDGDWRVVHDHVSVPADLKQGKAVLDLEP
jgi:ketosteroid isomerase-like protein